MQYENPNQLVVVTDTAAVYPLPAPTRTELQKMVAVREGSNTAFTMELFSRALNGPAVNVIAVENAGGKCRFLLETNPQVRLGDPLVVTGCDVVAYNTTHRVSQLERRNGGYSLLTDVNYTVHGTGGQAQLTIAAAEAELYRLVAAQNSTAGVLAYTPPLPLPFSNQDPRRHDGSSQERKIYLRFNAVASYRVTLTFRSDETFSF